MKEQILADLENETAKLSRELARLQQAPVWAPARMKIPWLEKDIAALNELCAFVRDASEPALKALLAQMGGVRGYTEAQLLRAMQSAVRLGYGPPAQH